MSKYQGSSLYCYEGTNLLRNKFQIKDQTILDEVEKLYTMLRIAQLNEGDKTFTFTIQGFKDIHSFIFGDVYEFAGEFRLEGISKGSSVFAHPAFLQEQAERIFYELNNERNLNGTSVKQLAERLAYYASELNALHPFREGNGRTIREFIRQLAQTNQRHLDWNKASRRESLEAFIDAYKGNSGKLTRLMYRCLR
jgi:cell filamentation protein